MKGKLVRPKTFLMGYSTINWGGFIDYLTYTGNESFLESIKQARDQGISEGEILCSTYAKVCYKSLTPGKNANVTRVRDIPDNVIGCFQAGHGSVFGHCNINFVTTDCSRVFTHELVRNHVGTEFSQTSGRYVRLDKIDLIVDPILEGCEHVIHRVVGAIEDGIYEMECVKGLRVPPDLHATHLRGFQHEVDRDPMFFTKTTLDVEHREQLRWVPDDKRDFTYKKKVTSAIRRVAPNGQSNEIGWSINLRALRHVIQMRSSRHAEWEIRSVMSEVHDLVKEKFPLIFHGCRTKMVDGLPEFTGMKTQPYVLDEKEVLKAVSIQEIREELEARVAKE